MRTYIALFFVSAATIAAIVLAAMMYNVIIPRDPSDNMMWAMFWLFVFAAISCFTVCVDTIKDLLK